MPSTIDGKWRLPFLQDLRCDRFNVLGLCEQATGLGEDRFARAR